MIEENDDYPSEEILDKVRHWKWHDFEGLAQFLCENWHWNDEYAHFDGVTLTLHTGGWSGNEDLISSIAPAVKGLYLYSFQRGGHYIFKR